MNEGYQWATMPTQVTPFYVYDCLYHVWTSTTPTAFVGSSETGYGVQGRSYGLNVQCPICGSTNVSGPRPAKVGEIVVLQNRDTLFVEGLNMFTGSTEGLNIAQAI